MFHLRIVHLFFIYCGAYCLPINNVFWMVYTKCKEIIQQTLAHAWHAEGPRCNLQHLGTAGNLPCLKPWQATASQCRRETLNKMDQ